MKMDSGTEIAYPLASGAKYDRVRFTAYDPVGNLLSRTDGNGQATNYAYADADGLLTAATYPGATANNVTVTYDGYDRPTNVTDGTGSSSTVYDDLGCIISSTRTYIGLPAKTFAYTYYPDGSRHTMTNPAGTWSYAYDGAGRYTSMTSPAGTTSATYGDNGWQSSRTLPNGVVTTYAYNPVGALTGLQNAFGSTTLSSYGGFAYDGAFNLTGMSATVPGASAQGGSTTYAYDAKDRLTGETSARNGGYAQAHAYDAAGNATTLRGAGRTFDADNRRATGSGFAWDGNGSPTQYGGYAMGHDAEGRLTSRGANWTAGYRADGLRGWKESNGSRTYLLYDGGNAVLEMSPNGNVAAVNSFAPDGLASRRQDNLWTHYAFDPQGSVAQRTSATGAVVSSRTYDAYGAETVQNASGVGGASNDPYGCNARWGYRFDREIGLYYCQARYYSPVHGGWTTRDPIGVAGGINVYGYCAGGPVGRMDARGTELPDGEGAVGGTGSGGGEGLGGGGIGLGGAGAGGGGGGGWVPEPAPINYPEPIGPPEWRGPGPQEWGGEWPNDVSGVYGPPRSIPDGPTTPGRSQLRWDLGNGWNITCESHHYDGWMEEGNPIWERHYYPHQHLNGPGGYHSDGAFPGDLLPTEGPFSPSGPAVIPITGTGV